MDMLDLIEKHFKTRDIYAVMKVTADDATDPKKLRSAYLKAAVVYHPDKVDLMEREHCTEKFQLIAKIHELLQDDDLKKIYDKTGEWPEDERFNLDEISLAQLNDVLIDAFKDYYLGSDEEREDVKKSFIKFKGNILDIVENVYFGDITKDEPRIQGIVDDLIAKKELEAISQKGNLDVERKKRIKKAKKEAVEAEEMLKEIRAKNGGGESSLRDQILSRRQQAGSSFLEGLEKKYANLEKQPRNKRSRRGD